MLSFEGLGLSIDALTLRLENFSIVLEHHVLHTFTRVFLFRSVLLKMGGGEMPVGTLLLSATLCLEWQQWFFTFQQLSVAFQSLSNHFQVARQDSHLSRMFCCFASLFLRLHA